MVKKILLLGLLLVITQFINAQTTIVSGTIITADLNDPLIGVNVVVGDKGTITDFDGKYSLELPNGTHDITFSYIGFDDKTDGHDRHTESFQGRESRLVINGLYFRALAL